MIVRKINQSEITATDIAEYKNRISKLTGVVFNASDVDMDKRIDTNKNKVRKTIRVPWVIVNTDNLGKVEFKADKEEWKDADEFFMDAGLLEAVLAQRAIDAINGIDITDPTRQYSETIVKTKEAGRNERVMLQGPNGEMEFVKAKKIDSYLQKGWNRI